MRNVIASWTAKAEGMRASGLLLAGFLTASAGAAQPQRELPERLDGVAAYVGASSPGEGVLIILRSDVELRARLSLLAAGAVDPARAPVPDELLEATLTELVGESLVAVEAARLGFASPSVLEVKQQRERLAAGADATLRDMVQLLGVSSAELDAIARRRATVGAFLAANLEATVAPSDAEVTRAYESEEHPFRAEPLDIARDRLAAWLSQKRLREGVARWVISLRERTPHRVLWSF